MTPQQREPVLLTYDPTDPGVVVKAGDEVSEVKFTERGERAIPNELLEPKSAIGPKRWERIMSELPSDRHRTLFVQKFGPPPEGVKPWKAPTNVAPATTSAPSPVRSAPTRVSVPAKPPASHTCTGPVTSTPLPAGAKSGMNPTVEAKLRAFMATPRTLYQIGAEMGWQRHTASARVSGLKKVCAVTIDAGTYVVAHD